jgi:hypothetical protein
LLVAAAHAAIDADQSQTNPRQRQRERNEDVGEEGEEAEIADGRFEERSTWLGDVR